MSFNSFEELEVFKRCRKFRKEIAALVKSNFPSDEKYLLKSQIIRSSRSVTAQIAEGFGRFHFQKTFNFVELPKVL